MGWGKPKENDGLCHPHGGCDQTISVDGCFHKGVHFSKKCSPTLGLRGQCEDETYEGLWPIWDS